MNNSPKDFNRKIKRGEIKMFMNDCPCSSTNFTKLFNYDRYGIWQPVVICKECSLI